MIQLLEYSTDYKLIKYHNHDTNITYLHESDINKKRMNIHSMIEYIKKSFTLDDKQILKVDNYTNDLINKYKQKQHFKKVNKILNILN